MRPLNADDWEPSQFAPLPSGYHNAAVFSGAGAKSVPVPDDANYVVFSSNVDFYSKFNATAAVPTGDVSDGSGSELNPASRRLPSGTSRTYGVAVGAAGIVTLSFYS